MVNLKKLISLGVIFILNSAVSFALSDLEGYPYRDSIEYLEQEGIINGHPDGTFRPNEAINRAELMKILVESAVDEADFSGRSDCFPDVKKEWFAQYVCYAAEVGWIEGYPDGLFKPGNTVNKVEAIKMLVNSQGIDLPASVSEAVFNDVPAGEWFSPYVKAAKDKGILIESGKYFYPADLMTRGVVSENIYRALVPSEIAEGESHLVVWANEGGEKITKDELRASKNSASVNNSVWDGDDVKIFGAKNEVLNFQLILESPGEAVRDIEVNFNGLLGPEGDVISSSGNDLFDWTERDIELFFVRYLEIKGLSNFMADKYDQRHLPEDWQASHDQYGIATAGWNSRADHNKLYPEIAVPLELEQGFDIDAGENQAIWVDIYIPKNAKSGIYYGDVEIVDGEVVKKIPVELEVLDFSLPDSPSAKTMLVVGDANLNERYLGIAWPNDPNLIDESEAIKDKHFMLAHRHKISLIGNGDHYTEDRPQDSWIPRLDGSLFTAQNGYAGPGVGVGNNIYSIGTYGSWKWKGEGKAAMQEHANNWQSWFETNLPDVEHFLYLIDESHDYEQIETWASWIEESSGPGKNLPSMATTWFISALERMPSLDVVASTMYTAETSSAQAAADVFAASEEKKLYMYNGGRPGQGSFMTEDDGVALRELAWGQFKKGIDRWFYWESTYYNNYQAGLGDINVFEQAHTFGGNDRVDESLGETGWNYSNGDGVLFYPGTDTVFPKESYDIEGPIASLRLKFWRRGIQDADYLALAMAKDPAATEAIINKIVPKVLWEYGVTDPNDPTWVRTEISWSDDPDVWEQARKELAEIILK